MTRLPPFSEFQQHGVGYEVPKNALRGDPAALRILTHLKINMQEVVKAKKWIMFSGLRTEHVFYQFLLCPAQPENQMKRNKT